MGEEHLKGKFRLSGIFLGILLVGRVDLMRSLSALCEREGTAGAQPKVWCSKARGGATSTSLTTR